MQNELVVGDRILYKPIDIREGNFIAEAIVKEIAETYIRLVRKIVSNGQVLDADVWVTRDNIQILLKLPKRED